MLKVFGAHLENFKVPGHTTMTEPSCGDEKPDCSSVLDTQGPITEPSTSMEK